MNELNDADMKIPGALNWKITCCSGTELLKESGFEKVKAGDFFDEEDLLKSKDDIKAGDTVYSLSLFGWYKMTICKDAYGELLGDSNIDKYNVGVIATLEFDKDARHCWVSSGHINKKMFKETK